MNTHREIIYMINLNATIRTETGKKVNNLRDSGIIPAVVYGPGVKPVSIQVDSKEFEKVFKQAGESSLIELKIDKDKKPVLVHDIQRDSINGEVTHIDFFQASLKEDVQVKVPLVFEGVSLAVKELGGTLVKNISELEIKALPQSLPHEIKVSIGSLNTFEDRILVKDIKLPEGVKAVPAPEEIAVSVAAPENVEEELAQEITENVEDVEKVEKEKKEEVVIDEPKE